MELLIIVNICLILFQKTNLINFYFQSTTSELNVLRTGSLLSIFFYIKKYNTFYYIYFGLL